MEEDDLLSHLPQDVLFLILSKLPTHSLVQLMSTSKLFNSTISHPHFLHLHLTSPTLTQSDALITYDSCDTVTKSHFSFANCHKNSVFKASVAPFNSYNGFLRLVGSVRGAVCLFDTNYHSHAGNLILWNPFFGKFKIVPSLEGVVDVCEGFSHVAVGFGFDCARSCEFKIVMILYGDGGFRPQGLVYGLKDGSWRSVKADVPCYLPRIWCRNVVVNGVVVHWLAYEKAEFRERPNCVMCFDVVDEAFKVMGLPSELEASVKEMKLCGSGDEKSVALFVSDFVGTGTTWSVWVMSEYGKVESWTKKYNVVFDDFAPLKMIGMGKILMVKREGRMIVFDAEDGNWGYFPVVGLPLSFHVTGYMPSLVLLDIGEQLKELNCSYWDLPKIAAGGSLLK